MHSTHLYENIYKGTRRVIIPGRGTDDRDWRKIFFFFHFDKTKTF